MKINKSDFISLSSNPNLFDAFHVWEVMIPTGPAGEMRFRQERFTREQYETPDALHEALMDFLRGCRFSDTEYYVFCDDALVTDL